MATVCACTMALMDAGRENQETGFGYRYGNDKRQPNGKICILSDITWAMRRPFGRYGFQSNRQHRRNHRLPDGF
jgi:hypothetical protein